MTTTRTVEVTVLVDVTIDETKFTPDFLAEFAASISDYDMDEHFCHLGWAHACREIDGNSFIEGYGPAKEMGIQFSNVRTDCQTVAP